MSDYKVITTSTYFESDTGLTRLCQEVKITMSEGWVPQGGITVHNGKYYQAMVKL